MPHYSIRSLVSWTFPTFLGLALPAQQLPLPGLLISQQSRTAFSIQGAGARAEGIGGAFTAVADDATAVSFNPAGLGQLLQPEVSLVGMSYRRELDNRNFISNDQAKPLHLSDSLARDQRTLPTFASASVPTKFLGKNLVFQLSWQRLFDLGQDTTQNIQETDPGGTFPTKYLAQYIQQKGQMDVWSAAVAYDFSPRFLVGVSFNVWRGAWNFQSNNDESLLPLPNTDKEFAQIQEDVKLRGSNWNIGVLWRSEKLNVGAVYRGAFAAHFDSRMATQSNVEGNKLPAQFTASHQLHWPETYGAGLAFRPQQQWLLALDWTRTRWSQAAFMPKGGSLDNLNFFDLQEATKTPDAETLRFGMEYLVFAGNSIVPLRVGLFKEPQPTADPASGEGRVLRGYTLGIGWKVRSLSVDVAYKFSQGSRRASQFIEADEIATNIGFPTSRGQENIHDHRIFLSFNFRFGNEGANRLLRWFFVQGN
ncbi:MAG: outer membrane protein transport protein [Holophagaceae bacterium]|nr:outer membrane protein transport protein [Holophagaceae bacterium]